jgi:hypothetical protein
LVADAVVFGPLVEGSGADSFAGAEPPEVHAEVTPAGAVDAGDGEFSADGGFDGEPCFYAAVAGVDVEEKLAGGDPVGDERSRPAGPPGVDLFEVDCGVVEAFVDEGCFAAGVGREDFEAGLGVDACVGGKFADRAE